MALAQNNFVIKDNPGDWVEVIQISGAVANLNSDNFISFTAKKGGRIKTVMICPTHVDNTSKIIPRITNIDFSQITYGQFTASATGFILVLTNLDAATTENNFCCTITIFGG